MQRVVTLLMGSLLAALLAASIPPAQAAGRPGLARQRCKLLLADGTAVTNLPWSGALEAVYLTKKFRGRYLANPISRLHPDGGFTAAANRPGEYVLRLANIDIAAFTAVKDKQGLTIKGLDSVIRLPFDYILRLSPPTRLVETTDPKTKRKRRRAVPMDIDWSQVKASLYDGGGAKKLVLRPEGKNAIALIAGGGPNRCLAISGPGFMPKAVLPRRPDPKRKGDLGRRIIKPNLIGFRLIPGNRGLKHPAGAGAAVFQVKARRYYWIQTLQGRGRAAAQLWLMSYDLKKQQGDAVRLNPPGDAPRGSGPRLYLDQAGGLRLFLRTPGANGRRGRCFALTPKGKVRPIACVYPAFEFGGRIIRGNEWIIPNFGGIPLHLGSNTILVTGKAAYGGRETGASQSYEITVEGPIPHVTAKPKPTACTGDPSRFDPHGDDRRYCLDPPVTPSFIKGPPPKKPQKCDKPCEEKFAKAMRAWQNYHPQTPCYADLAAGSAMVGGLQYPYVRKVKYRRVSAYDNQNRPEAWAEHEETISGLPPLAGSIRLVTNQLGYTKLVGPLNLREGPYPELRYLAKRFDPKQGRTTGKAYEVIKVYPQNYQVYRSGDQIVVDRSGLLTPGPPGGDSDHDGVRDQVDQCPGTPPGTSVDKLGCPSRNVLRVLSPDPERSQVLSLTGPGEVRIKLRYVLDAAPRGVIRVIAEHENGKLFSRDYKIVGPGGELQVAFSVKPPPGSPKFAVNLTLLPQGASNGPSQRVYYYFGLGSMQVKLETEKEVAAHPKNETTVTATITDADGNPIANRNFIVRSLPLEADYLEGGWLDHPGGASITATTDAQGKLQFLYIPPAALASAGAKRRGGKKPFPAEVRFEFRDRADSEKKALASLELVSPFPRITRLIMPGGDRAGQWQDVNSTLEIVDADSDRFRIAIYGPGDFGYGDGRVHHEKLTARQAASPFHFRFKSQPMGLDLNDIPSNWDVFKAFGMTNLKGIGRLALLYGGGWLLRRHKISGTPTHTTKVGFRPKTLGGGAAGLSTRLGSDIDPSIVKKIRVVTRLRNNAPQVTWATKFLYRGDAALGGAKNLLESGGALGGLPADLGASGMGSGYRQDAVLDGVHAGVGLVDAFVAVGDLIKASPPSLQTELLKLTYDNIKTGYGLLRKVQDQANAWDDVMYIPLLVEVSDAEGHGVRRMVRYAVKFSKLAGQP